MITENSSHHGFGDYAEDDHDRDDADADDGDALKVPPVQRRMWQVQCQQGIQAPRKGVPESAEIGNWTYCFIFSLNGPNLRGVKTCFPSSLISFLG